MSPLDYLFLFFILEFVFFNFRPPYLQPSLGMIALLGSDGNLKLHERYSGHCAYAAQLSWLWLRGSVILPGSRSPSRGEVSVAWATGGSGSSVAAP